MAKQVAGYTYDPTKNSYTKDSDGDQSKMPYGQTTYGSGYMPPNPIDAPPVAHKSTENWQGTNQTPAPTPTTPPPTPPMASLAGGGAAPPTTPPPTSAAPAMASLMGQQGPDPGDVSQAGPSGIRQGLGMRVPPQYNYALASLQRGAY